MMTPETLAPSANVARAATKAKMRFLYPLAAVFAAAIFLAPGAADAGSQPSQPVAGQAH